jgi:hypothetical protein
VRNIGLDVHRDFCEVALVAAGEVRSAGRIEATPAALELFAGSLCSTDRVALEVTGNTWEIARILQPHALVLRPRPRLHELGAARQLRDPAVRRRRAARLTNARVEAEVADELARPRERPTSPTAARNVAATITFTPGTVISRLICGEVSASLAIARLGSYRFRC